jgi:hypothetical protein
MNQVENLQRAFNYRPIVACSSHVVEVVVVKFIERSAFVEVLPGLVPGFADPVEVFRRPAGAEDARSEVLGERCEAGVCPLLGIRQCVLIANTSGRKRLESTYQMIMVRPGTDINVPYD